ncbi:GIY-YIG nuclease family protein [Streptomyces libani]|uniref:GIY-YIG nuclease family protein n=1 Tax=Streptomyces nigrescens TaxID=1920 RepID=UPI00380ECABA
MDGTQHKLGPTALYRLYDTAGGLLYVGVTNNPTHRFGQHKADKAWWGEVVQHSIEWFDGEWSALQAEVEAIATEEPKYNRRSTERYKVEQRATALAISAEARRRRGVGVAARAVQVRTLRELLAQGVPKDEAERQALLARQSYKAASGLFA